jgi:hypothetical protein
MRGQDTLGSINDTAAGLAARPVRQPVALARSLLPLGWILAAVGYFGPWIAHQTAALTITGVDMAEFVKFLPEALEGSLPLLRQLFYLPPVAVIVGVAFLAGSSELRYPLTLQALFLGLSVPLSLQLLPPAWSPGMLLGAEFRLQTAVLVLCWLLLAAFWLLARLPLSLRSALAATLGLVATALPSWQLFTVKPAIDGVYGQAVGIGWGLLTCLSGLSLMIAVSTALFLASLQRKRGIGSRMGLT